MLKFWNSLTPTSSFLQYGNGVVCALQEVDKVVSAIMLGELTLPERSYQRYFSKAVHEANEINKQTQLVNHLQQLRLRAPKMIKKEYNSLIQKAKEREDVSESNNSKSLSTIPSGLKTREVFPNLSKSKQKKRGGGGVDSSHSMTQINVNSSMQNDQSDLMNVNNSQISLLKHRSNNITNDRIFVTDMNMKLERDDDASAFYSISPQEDLALDLATAADQGLANLEQQRIFVHETSVSPEDTQRRQVIDHRFRQILL